MIEHSFHNVKGLRQRFSQKVFSADFAKHNNTQHLTFIAWNFKSLLDVRVRFGLTLMSDTNT